MGVGTKRRRSGRTARDRWIELGLMVLLGAVAPASWAEEGTCLVAAAENLAAGEGNFYLYALLAKQAYTFQAGDRLEYDVYLPACNPVLKGGIDADLRAVGGPDCHASATSLRDNPLQDAQGIRLHGDGVLTPARDAWYHRVFDLTPVVGCTAERWTIVFEGDKPGQYVQLLANVRITRGGQTVQSIDAGGPPPEPEETGNSGYSRGILLVRAPRAVAGDEAALRQLLAQAQVISALRTQHAQFRAELDVVRTLVDAGRLTARDPNAARQALDAAARAENTAALNDRDLTVFGESLRTARDKLAPFKPLLAKYTGHLVGHAHIDLQWLWTWDETVRKIIPETFGQAVKFLKEFPEFTFSQSSAALYLATQEAHPALFAELQRYAADGRWEAVGGRWCEADQNLIAPESHVRQYLYAQRYFQQQLRQTCVDGWEPDTFGHPATLPQILRKGGLRSYYFCRGGADRPGHAQDSPLFWWAGPDGSQVLAFDESALGGWYNGTVDDARVQNLAKFAAATGARDYLMVYGVGNHGGGPTRENIVAALAMKDRLVWPRVQFATLRGFFDRLLAQQTELKLPTVRGELNPIFTGCYTTHSRIKRYNRDSEVLLTTAEVFAALAADRAEEYPHAELERLWRDVLWNQHHDTLGGSFVGAASVHSTKVYEALQVRGTELLAAAQRNLLARRGPAAPERAGNEDPNTLHAAVFNALAWPRTDVVEVALTVPPRTRGILVEDEQGRVAERILDAGASLPVDANAPVVLRCCFMARDIPGCGFKVFRVRTLKEPAAALRGPVVGAPLPELTAHLQHLHERPTGMSAWTLGEVDRTDELQPAGADDVVEGGYLRRRVQQRFVLGESRLVQDIVTTGGPRAVYETTVDWRQVGEPNYGGDMLKVAFDTGLKVDTVVCDAPFGDVTRPADGLEGAALKWCAVTGRDAEGRVRTVAVLNDCKHAYDVRDGVVRLTLLRSSYEPDPRPDVGQHRMRYAALSFEGPLDRAAVARAGWEFNYPLQAVVVAVSGSGPLAWFGCTGEPNNIIVTALKGAEDGDGLILRAYECAGRATVATFTLALTGDRVREVDFLERDWPDAGPVKRQENKLTADFRPYEIRTFRLGR